MVVFLLPTLDLTVADWSTQRRQKWREINQLLPTVLDMYHGHPI